MDRHQRTITAEQLPGIAADTGQGLRPETYRRQNPLDE